MAGGIGPEKRTTPIWFLFQGPILKKNSLVLSCLVQQLLLLIWCIKDTALQLTPPIILTFLPREYFLQLCGLWRPKKLKTGRSGFLPISLRFHSMHIVDGECYRYNI